MMPGFNLATDPFIPVITDTGTDLRSIPGAMDDDVIDLVSGRELEELALRRLLLAVQIDANANGLTAREWAAQHHGDLDLFDPQRPFAQNPDMARLIDTPKVIRPLIDHDYGLAGAGSTTSNLFHSHSGVTYAPAEAARLLLARQQISVGGIQSFPSASTSPYGAAVKSANRSVAVSRSFAWIDTGRWAQTLRVNAALASTAPTGKFHFTWPGDRQPPITDIEPRGVLDALTWISRSAYLIPGDPVPGIAITEGIRWPEPGSTKFGTRLYTDEDEAALIPHALYQRKTTTSPLTPVSVHISSPVWRQILTAFASEDQPEGSVIAAAREMELPAGSRIRFAGLSSFTSKLHGPVSGSFPIPHPDLTRTDLATIADITGKASGEHSSELGTISWTIAHPDGAPSGGYPGASESRDKRLGDQDWVRRAAETLAADAVQKKISIPELRAAVDDTVAEATARSVRRLAHTRPLTAARSESAIAGKRKASKDKELAAAAKAKAKDLAEAKKNKERTSAGKSRTK